MQKNVKGYIGLCAGLLSIILVIAAGTLRLEPIKGSSVKFYGSANVYMCVAALVIAIVAIVFGALSKKDADKKGPRKPGVIIGIIMIFVSLIGMLFTGGASLITDYANNGENSKLYQALKDSDDGEKTLSDLDRTIDQYFDRK